MCIRDRAGPARDLGFDRSMVIGYGQDDRVCAYTSLMAQLEVERPSKAAVCVLVDKEEIGSVGATGMASQLDVYKRQASLGSVKTNVSSSGMGSRASEVSSDGWGRVVSGMFRAPCAWAASAVFQARNRGRSVSFPIFPHRRKRFHLFHHIHGLRLEAGRFCVLN